MLHKTFNESEQEVMHFSALPFNEACRFLRMQLKNWTAETKGLMKHQIFDPQNEHDGMRDESEMCANIMLAYRHLEDATMRVGKAIQAYDGGKSIYGDK